MGRAFAVFMRSEHRDQASFCPFALRDFSVHADLALEHLRYSLTDVPPQSNFPPGSVLESDHAGVYLAIGTLIRLALEHRDNRVETPAHALRPSD